MSIKTGCEYVGYIDQWTGDERKQSSIGACCRGKRPTAYGYKWRYV